MVATGSGGEGGKTKRTGRRAHELQRQIERRARVARLRLAGVRDQRLIAAQLGVHHSTISRDMKWLDQQYEQRAYESTARWKGLLIERYEELLIGLWQAARGDAATRTAPDLTALKRLIEICRELAKLTGAYAPVRIDLLDELVGEGVQLGLSTEQARALAERAARDVEERRGA